MPEHNIVFTSPFLLDMYWMHVRCKKYFKILNIPPFDILFSRQLCIVEHLRRKYISRTAREIAITSLCNIFAKVSTPAAIEKYFLGKCDMVFPRVHCPQQICRQWFRKLCIIKYVILSSWWLLSNMCTYSIKYISNFLLVLRMSI